MSLRFLICILLRTVAWVTLIPYLGWPMFLLILAELFHFAASVPFTI